VFTDGEEWLFDDWCVLSIRHSVCLSVCLSVSLRLSVPWYLSERSHSSKYAGINEAMNDVLTCHKFHLLFLANTFKCKTKTKTKNAVVTLTFRHQIKERKYKYFAYFQNEQFATCSQSLFELLHTWHCSQRWSSALCWWRMFECALCPVRLGLRHCEHIITIYVNKYALIYIYKSEYVISERYLYSCIENDGKGEGGILIRFYLLG
jgi:Arc/MetJ family transcription regulator